MTAENIVITAVLLVVLAEVTYLVAKLPRATNSRRRMVFVDTSVLIDGRIIPVAKSGFVGGSLVIPRSVIGELQFLADNADHDKRARARYGLDVVKELQELKEIEVTILQDGSKAEEGVDERLLKLAKKYSGAVCTIDYNLNKVAVVEGIPVLNVNELAQSIRMAYLPGERIVLEMVQKGQDSHQAVGYLSDGTMVVVEHAYKLIGQSAEIEFIRSLQTTAGKMMFAKLITAERPAVKQKPIGRQPRPQQPDTHVQAHQPAQKPAVHIQSPPVAEQHAHRPPKQASRPPVHRAHNETKPPQARPNNKRRNQADQENALMELVDKQ